MALTATTRTNRASKLVNKALSGFTKAAVLLEIAASEHLAASDDLTNQGAEHYERGQRALANAQAEGNAAFDQADVAEEAAYQAQMQANKLRSLLTV